jgi:hypothetical protein
MIGDRFLPARVPAGSGVPDIQYLQHTSGYAGILGSVLVFSSGEVAVGGADPTPIVGVALAAANTAPGYNAQNNPAVFTGRERKIAVARANRSTVFIGYLTNGSSTKVAPTIANVGISYGITAYSNIWTVDTAKTGASERVTVIGIDLLNNTVFFKFKEAHLATP